MVKTIIFDLGNVVLNFDHRLISEGLAAFSRYSSEDLYSISFHSEVFKLYDLGKIESEELFKWVKKRFDMTISYDTFQCVWSDIFSLNESLEPVLSDLKKNGYSLLLLSNTNRLHFDFIQKNFKVVEAFDECVLSYRLGYAKPHVEMYKEALRRTKSKAEDCAYIDDIKEFCEAGQKLGIHSIVFTSTEQVVRELKEIGVKIGQQAHEIF